jgi:putative ABC transport system substrate-binding protein
MKVARKAMMVVLALVLVLVAGSLVACKSGGGDAATPAADAADTAAAEKVFKIGAVQPVEHPALDEIFNGFKEALAENGYIDGKNIEIDYQNGQGDANTLGTIADSFVADKKDLVLAIATGPAQTLASKTTEIPILGAGITSFTVAGLVDSNEAPGGNVTGTSDMAPVPEQIELIQALAPDAKTIGFLYTSSEPNSVEQVGLIRDALEAKGVKTTEVTVVNANDVQQAVQSIVKKCDAIYIPTDNTMAASMSIVSDVANKAKIPVFPGATSMVEEGGLATAGVDYHELGRESGLMAIEILKGADVATMPVRSMTKNNVIEINGATAKLLGITVPEKYAGDVKDY